MEQNTKNVNKPKQLEPVLRNKRNHCNEKPTHRNEEQLLKKKKKEEQIICKANSLFQKRKVGLTFTAEKNQT